MKKLQTFKWPNLVFTYSHVQTTIWSYHIEKYMLNFVCRFGNRLKMMIIVTTALCLISTVSSSCILTVNKDENGYTSVPQDINISVTCLSLVDNKISIIDNTSFRIYKELHQVNLNYNPLVEVKAGVFYNNPQVTNFYCFACKIASLPSDFGPATSTLEKLHVGLGLKDISVWRQLKIKQFPKLKSIIITGTRTSDINDVYLPPTINSLRIDLMRLTVFPNLTSVRFPKLGYLRASRNQFQETPNPFLGLSKTVWFIDIRSAKLRSAGGIESVPRLGGFRIHDNELETVPDLLGLKWLKRLRIAGNSRMNCDYRMCWRRLWKRMRAPLVEEDDVTCVEPPLLANKKLSLVNPKFMWCDNGKSLFT